LNRKKCQVAEKKFLYPATDKHNLKQAVNHGIGTSATAQALTATGHDAPVAAGHQAAAIVAA
jgi:hypothetical protein